MLGFNFIKFDASNYVIHYANGKVRKEGRGLAFIYYAPTSSISVVQVTSNDVIFVFNEVTQDFQQVTIQGQVTYRVAEPRKLAEYLDMSVDAYGHYKTDDSQKIAQRLTNESQTSTSALVKSLPLREALRSAQRMVQTILEGLKNSEPIRRLGIEPLSVNVTAVSATPEMARALEAQAREALQQDADQAVYKRRNFAVDQERMIKESEIGTEITLEDKRRQVAEKQNETQVLAQQNKRHLSEMQLEADTALEAARKELIDLQTQNERRSADNQAYVTEVTLKPYRDMDYRVLLALTQGGMDPKLNLALAFRELATGAGKIGSLNISPELLQAIMDKPYER